MAPPGFGWAPQIQAHQLSMMLGYQTDPAHLHVPPSSTRTGSTYRKEGKNVSGPTRVEMRIPSSDPRPTRSTSRTSLGARAVGVRTRKAMRTQIKKLMCGMWPVAGHFVRWDRQGYTQYCFRNLLQSSETAYWNRVGLSCRAWEETKRCKRHLSESYTHQT
jgi:hypothetical protein